jgi:hypothetical protein
VRVIHHKAFQNKKTHVTKNKNFQQQHRVHTTKVELMVNIKQPSGNDSANNVSEQNKITKPSIRAVQQTQEHPNLLG